MSALGSKQKGNWEPPPHFKVTEMQKFIPLNKDEGRIGRSIYPNSDNL